MPTINLTLPVAGQGVTAGLHATNYAALQSLLNGGLDDDNVDSLAPSKLSQMAATTGQVLVWDGSQWEPGNAGSVLAYGQVTSPVTVTATGAATANTVATAGAITADGTSSILVQAYAPGVSPANSIGAQIHMIVVEGTTVIADIAEVINTSSNQLRVPLFAALKLTPAAGSRTYSLRAYVSTGSGNVSAGTGTGGAGAPAFIRVSRET